MKIYLPGEGFHNYTAALEALGADVERRQPEGCAGLLLPGGGDINPARYGQADHGCLDLDPARDAREWEALRCFAERQLPVLGICRGCQLISVFFGGTLHQDIPGHRRVGEEDTLHPARTDDPWLRSLYGEECIVNSSHHQAVDRPGRGLKVVQRAEDGTVEAIRHESLPIFGVQWHPERLRHPTDGWLLIARWLLSL